MTTANLTVIDLVVVLVVGLSVLGALRRRRGLLSALASGCLVAIACWLGAAVVLAVGPPSWHRLVADSSFAQVAQPPVRAVHFVVHAFDAQSAPGSARAR